MNLGKLFQPIPNWDMTTAKKYIDEQEPDSFNLVDVRQPGEYTEGHLPGATLLPLDQIASRVGELDKEKVTLVYCRSGGRAGNATSLLTQVGFAKAFNIGGIMQWNGLVADGPPEASDALFDPNQPAEAYVLLAWVLEEGAEEYYQFLAQRVPAQSETFTKMARGETAHRDLLAKHFKLLTGGEVKPNVLPAEQRQLMEGGIDRQAAMKWSGERPLADLLDFVATMEANAHDRYLRAGKGLGGETQKIFFDLAQAEKAHLNQVLALLEQAL